jgi:hypothetical protein
MYIPDTSDPSLKFLNIEGCTALVDLYIDDSDFSAGFPDLSSATALEYFDADECNITGSLNLSALPALTGFDLSGNIGLTSVTISSSQPLGNGNSIYLYDCALTQTVVNNILVALAANDIDNGYVDLSGGTNAIPSAPGLFAKTALEGKGWSVTVNI